MGITIRFFNMNNGLASTGRVLALKGIVVQIFTSLLLCILALVFNTSILYAVLLGCISFVIPHSIFAYWVFRYAGATKNNLVAQSLSQGMKIKLILTSVLFIVAFSQFNAHPLPLLGAYATIMVSQWLAMFVLK
jgi:ATP synthase protein I